MRIPGRFIRSGIILFLPANSGWKENLREQVKYAKGEWRQDGMVKCELRGSGFLDVLGGETDGIPR